MIMEKILINAADVTHAVLLVCCVFYGLRLFWMLYQLLCFSFFVIIVDWNNKYYDVKCSQYSRNVYSRNSSVNVIFKSW